MRFLFWAVENAKETSRLGPEAGQHPRSEQKLQAHAGPVVCCLIRKLSVSPPPFPRFHSVTATSVRPSQRHC